MIDTGKGSAAGCYPCICLGCGMSACIRLCFCRQAVGAVFVGYPAVLVVNAEKYMLLNVVPVSVKSCLHENVKKYMMMRYYVLQNHIES